MRTLGLGIVGTGSIAKVVANAGKKAEGISLIGVSSREITRAEIFAKRYFGMTPVQGLKPLLNQSGIDAIYVGTPTTTKEDIALQAISAGKHVLIEKPFANSRSVERITQVAKKNRVIFMDATHFLFHPRTSILKEEIVDRLGIPKSLHAAIYFGNKQSDNIRLNPCLEPMGAYGDLAWYAMRAIVEFLRPEGKPKVAKLIVVKESKSQAVIRASGMLNFKSEKIATFDVGYTAQTAIMDLSIIGTKGMISLDDYILDWSNSFAFHNHDIPVGFIYRKGMASRNAFEFVPTPSNKPQEVLMLEKFTEATLRHEESDWIEGIKQTQDYLDAAWSAI